jgi:hypothetical protein
MSLNSCKNQRNFHFKKKIIQQGFTKNSNKILIEPYVKLKNVWFSEEQNKIVLSMYSLTFIVGLIIGIIIGVIL